MAVEMPIHLAMPVPAFQPAYWGKVAAGTSHMAQSSVAFVGLARSCDGPLASNLEKVLELASKFASWRLHIEENDSEDQTVQVLQDFCRTRPQATFTSRRLDREHFGAEFAGPRTLALAEYRSACQRWVRDCAADADYVVVLDFDAWGGFVPEGVCNAFGWLASMPHAFGMASVSLFQHRFADGPHWAHYDLWALRGVGQPDCTFDTYRNGMGGWGYVWMPPVGSPPVVVGSAFGGMGIYRTSPYLAGTYDGSDCEHVTFHQSVRRATGLQLYLCPSMRTVMHWIVEADADGRQHVDD
jgi:hypothetical protein